MPKTTLTAQKMLATARRNILSEQADELERRVTQSAMYWAAKGIRISGYIDVGDVVAALRTLARDEDREPV